jgi:hypothetical protein
MTSGNFWGSTNPMITSSYATGGVSITNQQLFIPLTQFGTSTTYYFNKVGNYLWLFADVTSNTAWVTFFMEPTVSNTGSMNCLDMGILRKGPARGYKIFVMLRTGATEGTSIMVIIPEGNNEY